MEERIMLVNSDVFFLDLGKVKRKKEWDNIYFKLIK